VRTVTRTPAGPAATVIAATATEVHADLVLIATHAGNGISRPSHVSVARELLDHCGVPLLLLSSGTMGPFAMTPEVGLSILVGLDTSRSDAQALACAELLAKAFAARLVLLCAKSAYAAQAPAARRGREYLPDAASTIHTASYLEARRDELLRHGVAVWTGLVEGDLYTELVHLGLGTSQLVIFSSHGSATRREAVTEATMRVLRQSGPAVLVIPQQLWQTCLEAEGQLSAEHLQCQH
jgi:nucleotide-binding universal stress UspA family protein